MASDLMTFTEWLTATGKEAGSLPPEEQARAEWCITAASEVIRQYLDRDLTLQTDATPGPRTFRYLGTRVVEIDDNTGVTQVEIAQDAWNPAPRVLDPTEYIQASSSANLPVIDSLELWTNLPFAMSPAMGFERNEDRYGWRPHPIELTVTADWGWPSIPQDIKMALVWEVGELMADVSPYTTESIAGYSISYRDIRGSSGAGPGQGGSAGAVAGITPRAQALLEPYARVNV